MILAAWLVFWRDLSPNNSDIFPKEIDTQKVPCLYLKVVLGAYTLISRESPVRRSGAHGKGGSLSIAPLVEKHLSIVERKLSCVLTSIVIPKAHTSDRVVFKSASSDPSEYSLGLARSSIDIHRIEPFPLVADS